MHSGQRGKVAQPESEIKLKSRLVTIASRRLAKLFQSKATLWALFSVGLVAAGVIAFATLYASPDARAHSLPHVLGGTPAAFLAIAALQLWKPRRPAARVAWPVFIVALLVFGIGQIAESIGAFGWVDDEARYPILTALHDAVVLAPPLGLFVAFMAVPWLVTAAVAKVDAAKPARMGNVVVAVNVAIDMLVVGALAYLLATGQ